MPAQFARAQRNFCPGLLHLVLAEKNLAEPGRRRHDFRRLALGHRQQGDGIRVAPGAFARGANPLLDFFKVIGQTHAAIVNRKS